MKKKLVLMLLLACSNLLFSASNTNINGLYYILNYDTHTATLDRGNSYYNKEIIHVPSKVVYEGEEYIVDSVLYDCFSHANTKNVILPNTIRGIGTNAFFISEIESCVIPSSVKYVGQRILWDCNKLKYFEIGENVVSLPNVGSKFQEANSRSFQNNIVVKWNAKRCADFKLGKKEYILKLRDWFYPSAETPFWKGTDEYDVVNNEYTLTKYYYKMRCYITEFRFGQQVEHIPAYLCYNLQRLTSLTIPRSVQSIGELAFGECNSITSVIIEASTPPTGNGGLDKSVKVYVPCQSYEAYKSSDDWKDYDIQINPYSYISHPTSVTITMGCGDDHGIASVGIVDGEPTAGNILEYIGLDPESDYIKVPFVLTYNTGTTETINVSFATTALELTTLESKAASSTTAILLAKTNIDDKETNCGFEWKRYDAPSDMNPKKEYAIAKNGMMAGRLKGLNDNVYYQYRAFYESASGKMYYGGWQYIFTGDAGVEFEPILYTEPAAVVKEHEATLRGFALAGSDDITEQGFEYWIDRRADEEPADAPLRAPAAYQHYTVPVEGIAMEVTLTDLDPGTVYKYRAYATAGGQTFYGSEVTFVTRGIYEGPAAPQAIDQITNDPSEAAKILRNGQIFILRGDRTYTLTGQEVK